MARRGELQARERAAVADVVASTLRHELRNKLASIRNASFYLMRRMQKTDAWTSDPRVETFFQLIEKELAAAEQVLSQRAPPEAGDKKARCRPRDAAQAALDETPLTEGVKVERDWAETGQVALAVEDLALLVRCLLDNALEAMPRGGTLTVRTKDLENGGVSVRVEDTGEGLPPEAYSRAFEPFFTTRPGHAGLGLSIVHRMALRHGWKVELTARPAGGTCVEILFTGLEAEAEGGKEFQGSK
jgi:signal transduction histidine kinase